MMNVRSLTLLTVFAACSIHGVPAQDCAGLQAGFFANTFPVGVQLSNASTGTGFNTSWYWSFGDGATSTDPQPLHNYNEPGWYVVCLTAASTYEQQGGGVFTCVDTLCQEVFIPGETSPCDSINAFFEVGVDGAAVSFFNVLSDPQYSYYWQFGDGSVDYGPDPVHTYPGPGIYEACLLMWAWDPQTQDTCFADHCVDVVIGGNEPCDQLQAGFLSNTFPGGAQFSNATEGTGFNTSWYWSFGDGATSTDPQPLHNYNEPGWYVVCLTAASTYEQQGGGVFTCVDTLCQEVFIPGEAGPCDSINAFFEVGVDGAVASFFNVLSDPQYSYYWQFGDGSVDFGPNPVHTYPGPGTYEACLLMWAWDPQTQDSCFADHCVDVVIGGGDPCDQLQAGFTANVGNATVWFSNNTSGTGFQTTWSWDFGDGTTSTDAQPTHVFPGLGSYEVCLTATSIYELQGGGVITCQDTYCQVVITGVSSPCDSVFLDFDWSAQGTSVLFEATPSPGASFHWYFGDGTNGLGSPITHLYEPGQDSIWVCLVGWYVIPGTSDSCAVEHCELVQLALSTTDTHSRTDLVAYPIPFSDALVIEGAVLSGPAEVIVLDIAGRQVHSETVRGGGPREVLALPDLATGQYLLRLISPRGNASLRVQKN